MITGCGGLVVLAVVAVIAVGLLWKKDMVLTAAAHSWERTIEIEKYQAVGESDWCDAMPSGATDVSRSREVRDHKQVPDGETCTTKNVDKGDGTFDKVEECQPKYKEEPVYDDKCSYEVNKWKTTRTAKASGSSVSDTPAWRDVGQLRTGSSVGSERQGAKSETYRVVYKDADGGTHDCSYPQAKWSGVAAGSKWTAEAGVLFSNLDCDSLRAQ